MMAERMRLRPGLTLTEVSLFLLALISLILSVVGAAFLLKRPFG